MMKFTVAGLALCCLLASANAGLARSRGPPRSTGPTFPRGGFRFRREIGDAYPALQDLELSNDVNLNYLGDPNLETPPNPDEQSVDYSVELLRRDSQVVDDGREESQIWTQDRIPCPFRISILRPCNLPGACSPKFAEWFRHMQDLCQMWEQGYRTLAIPLMPHAWEAIQ